MHDKTRLMAGVLMSTVSTIALGLNGAAIAQTNIKVNCRNPQSQYELNFCADQSAKVADRQLNRAYQKVYATLKGTPRESQLVDAQRAWIQFRDTNCAFERDRYKGGSISPLIYSSCVERLSKQRTQDLKASLAEP